LLLNAEASQLCRRRIVQRILHKVRGENSRKIGRAFRAKNCRDPADFCAKAGLFLVSFTLTHIRAILLHALPERGVTVHSGDMGYTMGPFAGSAECPGRRVNPWMNVLNSLPGCWTGRRWRGSAGIRHLTQDRLQDPHALQRYWSGRAHRSLAPAVPPRQPVADPDRGADRPLQAG
jgi:hypothetical protein